MRIGHKVAAGVCVDPRNSPLSAIERGIEERKTKLETDIQKVLRIRNRGGENM